MCNWRYQQLHKMHIKYSYISCILWFSVKMSITFVNHPRHQIVRSIVKINILIIISPSMNLYQNKKQFVVSDKRTAVIKLCNCFSIYHFTITGHEMNKVVLLFRNWWKIHTDNDILYDFIYNIRMYESSSFVLVFEPKSVK